MEHNDIIIDLLERIIKAEKDIEFLKKENNDLKIEIKDLKFKSFQSDNYRNSNYLNQNKINDGSKDICYQPEKTRDKTRYMFNGTIYLKNRLVLSIVSDYVNKHKDITKEELKKIFDKSLQGSMGVVENEEIAMQRKDFETRYFCKENEKINLTDGTLYVCSQWGCLNIPRFIARARELGYKIEEI